MIFAISFWNREFDGLKYTYKGATVDVGIVVENNWFKDWDLGISAGIVVNCKWNRSGE